VVELSLPAIVSNARGRNPDALRRGPPRHALGRGAAGLAVGTEITIYQELNDNVSAASIHDILSSPLPGHFLHLKFWLR
jgi:hypothetical protein